MAGQKSRYAVRLETWSLLSLPMGAVTGGHKPMPHVEYRYYRWRWLAKLCAFLDNGTSLAGCMTRATLLGKVTEKTAERRAWDMQRQMFDAARVAYMLNPTTGEVSKLT